MAKQHRSRMHTEALQNAFPEVYKEFYSKCSTVVSSPGSFFWSAGLAVIYGGVGVLQKLPLRVYVGIEHDGKPGIRFSEYIAYAPHQQQFEQFYHDREFESRFSALVNALVQRYGKPISGVIHVLSEVPRGAALNFSGASNMALSTLLAIESGFLSQEELVQLTSGPTQEVMRNPKFDTLFRMAWKLEANSHSDIGSGSAPFTSFFDSPSPMLFYSERRHGKYTDHPHTRYPSFVDGHYEVFDTIRYAGFRMKEFFHWRTDLSWPVDYGLIYLGQQKQSSIFLRPMHVVQQMLHNLEEQVSTDYSAFPSDPEKTIPAFQRMTEKGGNPGYWEKSVDFLILLSVKAVQDLRLLIENGTAESLEEVCHTVQLQEKIYEFFTKGIPTTGAEDVLQQIQQVLSQKAQNGLRSIRFLPDRPGGGGDLLFIAPQAYLQDHVDELQTILRTHVSPMLRIDYLSWDEGTETSGTRVEQHLEQKHHSPFLSDYVLKVKEWNSSSIPGQRMYSLASFESSKASIDLLVDEVEQKICISGVPLTSKDIKSAKATIEILKVLLENYGQEVRAVLLPESSYVERNEMQSKIVSPLTASFKRMTGKKLPLVVRGGLRKNFVMKIEPSNLKIGLIHK